MGSINPNDPHQVLAWMDQTDENLRRIFESHNGLNQQVMQIQRNQTSSDIKELLARTNSESMAYTNIVMAAGYAGFFALWSSLKSTLPSVLFSLVGLAFLCSLASFVSWEVVKMFARSKASKTASEKIAGKREPNIDDLRELQTTMAEAANSTSVLWPYFLWPAIVFALLAAIPLAGALAWDLVEALLTTS